MNISAWDYTNGPSDMHHDSLLDESVIAGSPATVKIKLRNGGGSCLSSQTKNTTVTNITKHDSDGSKLIKVQENRASNYDMQ